jgi:hypothetical protein
MKGTIKSPFFFNFFFNKIQSIINLMLINIIKIKKNTKKKVKKKS